MQGGDHPLVYVSYAWRSRTPHGPADGACEEPDREAIVDELCGVLAEEEQIVVGRDKQLVKTGDSIVDFARDIASGGLILAVISHKSLRSDWCMVHELLQAFRRRNFEAEEFGSDVLALVLDDALEDVRDCGGLVRHWSARYEAELETMKIADPDRAGSRESWEAVNQLRELRQWLPDLIRALRIRAMPRGAEAIREQGFRAIRELVLKRLREKGLADRLSPSRLPPDGGEASAGVASAEPAIHFLALTLQRAHATSGDTNEPLYSWRIDLKDPAKRHYEPCDLPTTVGPHVRRSMEPTVPAAGATGAVRSSVVDLLQAVVDWLRQQPFGSACVVELFVPVEWLDVDWSALTLLDRRRSNSPAVELQASIPFVLRSWERLEHPLYQSARQQLEAKYACLARGDGVWLADAEACSPGELIAAETDPTRVGIKRLAPLEGDPEQRLRWLDSLLISMAPVALWQLHGRPDWSDKKRRAAVVKHLKRYGEVLAGRKTGHPVHRACARLESLPLHRKTIADDPLVHDIAFLLDHPERAPAAVAAQPALLSFL